MTGNGGHLFVVLGRIESVVHDVAVIPTASDFGIRRYWRPLTGEDTTVHRPTGLVADGHGPSPNDERLWFINVGAVSQDRVTAIGKRLAAAVEAIARRGIRPSANRTKALIAVPIIGVSGGGLDRRRGHVVEQQIRLCKGLAARFDVDIAIVTPDRATYGAAQAVRTRERQQPLQWDLGPGLMAEARRLGDLARDGQLALFLGAGVSIPAGLPTWDQLIDELSKGRLVGKESGMSALDQAQLIELRSKPGELGEQVARIIRRAQRPSLAHALLAGLGAKEVVTTNYDRLYEKAVATVDGRPAVILPSQLPDAGRPWILKLHGDVGDPSRIVLTRQHFVRFDAQTRPAGALLQSLLMTRHLLVVGASLNDDNVVRLAYEVQAYRDDHGLRGRFGTLLDLDGDALRQELWASQLKWTTLEGNDIADRARSLEIFLDAVAAHASSNQAWLLDRRFEGLLTESGRHRAKLARQLFDMLKEDSQAWRPLREALQDFGVDPPKGP